MSTPALQGLRAEGGPAPSKCVNDGDWRRPALKPRREGAPSPRLASEACATVLEIFPMYKVSRKRRRELGAPGRGLVR